jgi:hypothetical protein
VELGNITHILYENPGIIVTLITFLLHTFLRDLFEFYTHEQTDSRLALFADISYNQKFCLPQASTGSYSVSTSLTKQ